MWKNLKRMVLLFVFVLIIGGCEEKIRLVTYLTSSECKPPCWMDLTPGKSTEEEVILRLKQMPEYVNIESIYTTSDTIGRWVGWHFLNSEMIGQISFRDSKIDQIYISDRVPYRSQYGVRLERIIEIYGEPTDIFYGYTSGDVFAIRVNLIDRDKGISYFYVQSAPDLSMSQLFITPNQMIDAIEFFNPSDFPTITNSLGGTKEEITARHFKWNGYQEISIPD